MFFLDTTARSGLAALDADPALLKKSERALKLKSAAVSLGDAEGTHGQGAFAGNNIADPANPIFWRHDHKKVGDAPRGGWGSYSWAMPSDGERPIGKVVKGRFEVDKDFEAKQEFEGFYFMTDGYGERMPRGGGFIVVASTSHEQRDLIAFGAGGPLVADHESISPPDYSRHVYGMNGDAIDETRHAGLQGVFWVKQLALSKEVRTNPNDYQVALNFTASVGQENNGSRTGYGLATFTSRMKKGGGRSGPVIAVGTNAYLSAEMSGPLFAGHPTQDKHRLGQNDDGEMFNSGHVNTNAYFSDGSPKFDGPLEFEKYDYPEVTDGGTFKRKVHLYFDEKPKHPWVGGEKDGMWKWWVWDDKITIIPTTPYTPTPQPGGPPPGTPGEPVDWVLPPFGAPGDDGRTQQFTEIYAPSFNGTPHPVPVGSDGKRDACPPPEKAAKEKNDGVGAGAHAGKDPFAGTEFERESVDAGAGGGEGAAGGVVGKETVQQRLRRLRDVKTRARKAREAGRVAGRFERAAEKARKNADRKRAIAGAARARVEGRSTAISSRDVREQQAKNAEADAARAEEQSQKAEARAQAAREKQAAIESGSYNAFSMSGASLEDWKKSPRAFHVLASGKRTTATALAGECGVHAFPFDYNYEPGGDLGDNQNPWSTGTADGVCWFLPPEVKSYEIRHSDTQEFTLSQASVGMWGATIFGFGKAGDLWGDIVDGFLFQQSGSTLNVQGVDSAGVIDATKTIAFLTPVTLGGGACFANGTVGAPSIHPCADTPTGIYFPTTSQMAVSLAGSQKLLLTGNRISAGPVLLPTGQFVAADGAVGTGGFAFSDAGGFDTGMFSADSELVLSLNVGGTAALSMTNLGSCTVGFNLSVTNNASILGNTTLGNATTDTITFTARAVSDLVPSTNNTRDLGTSSLGWRDVFADQFDAMSNGSATTPVYKRVTDTNTGVYFAAADQLGIAAGGRGSIFGLTSLTFPNNAAYTITVAGPAPTSNGVDLTIRAGGADELTGGTMTVQGGGNYAGDTVGGLLQLFGGDASSTGSGHAGGNVSGRGGNASGLSAANGGDVLWDGGAKTTGGADGTVKLATLLGGLTLGRAGLTSTLDGVLSFDVGSAAAPSITFDGDTNTGIFQTGVADNLGFTTGGVVRRTIVASTSEVFTLQQLGPFGSAAAPTYSFSSDSGTGVYHTGSALGLTVGTAVRRTISTTDETFTLVQLGPAGSAGAPVYSRTGDANTGMYFSDADEISLATGGSQRVVVDSGGKLTAKAAMQVDGATLLAGTVRVGAPATLTIAAGVVTATTAFHIIAAESGTADDLDTINAPADGTILVIRPDTGDTITVTEVGNIALAGGTFAMNSVQDKLILIYDSGASKWCELGRNDNA